MHDTFFAGYTLKIQCGMQKLSSKLALIFLTTQSTFTNKKYVGGQKKEG